MTDAQVIELLRQAREFPSDIHLIHRIYKMQRDEYLKAQKLLEGLKIPKEPQVTEVISIS
jgi:hypothetical protein